MESRTISRYGLDLPVTFHWTDGSGRAFRGSGFTRDISSEAMFVITPDVPPCDALVACEVMLPRFRSATSMQISAQGRVLRVEHGLDLRRRGFAIRGNMLLLSNNLFNGATCLAADDVVVTRKSAN
jgi:hypothetical protein